VSNKTKNHLSLKKHWLLLASLILSLLIISIGQASYNQKIEKPNNQTTEEPKTLETEKINDQ